MFQAPNHVDEKNIVYPDVSGKLVNITEIMISYFFQHSIRIHFSPWYLKILVQIMM